MDESPQNSTASVPRWERSALVLVLASVAAKVLVHVATNWRHGFHFDEFYYVACGQRLAFGYVDHPPVTPLVARLFTGLLGDSVSALRLAPALAGALIVFLTAWLARELGGRSFAQVIAAAVALVSPAFLGAHTLFQTVALNQAMWAVGCCVLVRFARTRSPRYLFLFGVVGGLGLMTKLTMIVLLVAAGLALVVAPTRSVLRSPWPWLGALSGLLLFLPHLHWQMTHDWPTAGFVEHQSGKDWFFPGAPTLAQIVGVGPGLVPILVAGITFLFSSRGRRFSMLGWTYVFVLLIFELLRGKFYYPMTMYPLILAAGAVVVEEWAARGRRQLRRRAAWGAVLANLVFAPIMIPVFPLKTLVEYRLPHHPDFVPMLGWPELVSVVVDVWRTLPESDRRKGTILSRYYGSAGALDHYGSAEGLPKAVSGHCNYYFWGPGAPEWEVVIAVDFDDRSLLDELFASVEEVARFANPHAALAPESMPERRIYVCREPRGTTAELWPKLRLNF